MEKRKKWKQTKEEGNTRGDEKTKQARGQPATIHLTGHRLLVLWNDKHVGHKSNYGNEAVKNFTKLLEETQC